MERKEIMLLEICIIYVFIVVHCSPSSTSALSANLPYILGQYIKVCGVDYLCDKSFLSSKIQPDLEYKNLSLCPKCSCDIHCLMNGDCCPDLFFSLPKMQCDDLFILDPPTHYMKENSSVYQIVSSCPPNSIDKMHKLCNNTNDELTKRLKSLPVTGRKQDITYRNKYCAQCNNEHNVTEWNLDIECELFADFNFFNTLDEIIEHAKEKRCGIKFIPGSLPVRMCQKELEYDNKIINKCNETGKWSVYDVDIAKACESTYDLTWRLFKNIFCYICNPSVHEQEQDISILQCNNTGFWVPYDAGLENSCRQYGITYRTYPFKNVFCYLCNRNNTNTDLYLDISTQIVERRRFQKPYYFSYYINTLFFKIRYFNYAINKDKFSNFSIVDGQVQNDERILPNGQRINITSLVRTHFAYEGKYKYCSPKYTDPDNWFLPVFQKKCQCSKIFDGNSNPCIDVALKYPVQCRSNQIFSYRKLKSIETFSQVIVGCLSEKTFDIYKRFCELETTKSIFQIIPISSKYYTQTFSSLFCSICNQKITSTEFVLKIKSPNSDTYMDTRNIFGKPWDIEILCKNVLDLYNYVTLYELLLNARKLKCHIVFIPKDDIPPPKTCEPIEAVKTNKCNVTGHWENYDPDIKWACEQYDHALLPTKDNYKNVFCLICNPRYDSSSVVSKCNETGFWKYYSPNLVRACLIYPKVDTSYPFKNHFCRLCNAVGSHVKPGGQTTTSSSVIPPTTPSIEYPFTFRNMFSLNQFDDAVFGIESRKNCTADQIYDIYKGECRNVTCYQGKRLINDSCNPLLKVTSKLRYILTFKIVNEKLLQLIETGNSSGTTNMSYGYIMTEIKTGLTKQLIQSLQLKNGDLNFHEFSALGNQPCDEKLTEETSVEIVLNIDLFISGYVDRLKTEIFLMDFMDGNFSVSLNGLKLTSVKSKDAMYLSSKMKKADLDNKCFLGLSEYSFLPYEYYKSTFVDNVMTCKQIELETSEYQLDDVKMELKLKLQDTDLDFYRYKIMSDGKARVCIDILNVQYTSTNASSNTNTALGVLTLICVIVSLLCLFLTFLTYCIFPSLRSLPGKNLMLLIFTMFCAQICFVSGYGKITAPALCITRAILSHWFWLAMFGCMSVCTVHMYKVFGKSKIFLSSLHENNKMFYRYILYSYGVPVIICILNVVVHLGISRGTYTGYGGHFCFIDNKMSLIASFIVPIACICLLNVFLFSLTFYYIRNTPKVHSSNTMNRREVFIFIRLFALTGITWILQIVDSFLQLSVFSFIVTILIGLQGLYILLSYICTSRVLALYKGLLAKSWKKDSDISKPTSTNTLPSPSAQTDSTTL